jgi:hypothetical protein
MNDWLELIVLVWGVVVPLYAIWKRKGELDANDIIKTLISAVEHHSENTKSDLIKKTVKNVSITLGTEKGIDNHVKKSGLKKGKK